MIGYLDRVHQSGQKGRGTEFGGSAPGNVVLEYLACKEVS